MSQFKTFIKQIPIIGTLLKTITRPFRPTTPPFPGSDQYWEQRYAEGGNSGAGSYNRLALFKAKVINDFVKEKGLQSVIELGCGDGHQLALAQYPPYIGLDVSPSILQHCIQKFQEDTTKSFYLYHSLSFQDHHQLFKSDLALSLDVIYHLIEDPIFEAYMQHLFQVAKQYVIIYSSNVDGAISYHERDRKFTNWIEKNLPNWTLLQHIPNPYPYDPENGDLTSKADFYIFQKQS